jgi:hypothetical protein
MRKRAFIPCKANLVLLFKAARRRLSTQAGDVGKLTNARIVTATVELNQLTDDIRDAQRPSQKPPLAIEKELPLGIYTVGKILRRLKMYR